MPFAAPESLNLCSEFGSEISKTVKKIGPRGPQGVTPLEVPKNRSLKKRATPGKVHANGSRMGANHLFDGFQIDCSIILGSTLA